MIPYCGRPENFTELILKNWEQVTDEDTITIHLGDVIFSNASELGDMLKRIKGTKILVMGNHDLNRESWYMSKGFSQVVDSFGMHVDGVGDVLFTHIPRPKDSHYALNVHGHFHNTDHRSLEPEILEYYDPTYHKLLAIENTDYKPVEVNEFLKLVK